MGGRLMSYAVFACLMGMIAIFATCCSNDNASLATASPGVIGNEVTATFPQVNGPVFAMVSDGADGVYLGGRFTRVGTTDRPYLAHIKVDGTVDPSWNPTPDSPVTALLLQNQTVYVGGNFLNMNGEERWRLARRGPGDGTAHTVESTTGNRKSGGCSRIVRCGHLRRWRL